MKPTAKTPDTISEWLTDQGRRLTRPRRAILAALRTGDPPFTVDTLHARVAAQRVDRVTVYRTVHMLVQAGILRVVDGTREGVRYALGEQFTGHHAFLVCQQCGRIDKTADCPIPDGAIARVSRRLRQAKQFRVVEHEVRLLGLCRACHV